MNNISNYRPPDSPVITLGANKIFYFGELPQGHQNINELAKTIFSYTKPFGGAIGRAIGGAIGSLFGAVSKLELKEGATKQYKLFTDPNNPTQHTLVPIKDIGKFFISPSGIAIWQNNAKLNTQKNKSENTDILTTVIKDKNIIDVELFNFFKAIDIKQGSGWFQEKGKPREITLLLQSHRPLLCQQILPQKMFPEVYKQRPGNAQVEASSFATGSPAVAASAPPGPAAVGSLYEREVDAQTEGTYSATASAASSEPVDGSPPELDIAAVLKEQTAAAWNAIPNAENKNAAEKQWRACIFKETQWYSQSTIYANNQGIPQDLSTEVMCKKTTSYTHLEKLYENKDIVPYQTTFQVLEGDTFDAALDAIRNGKQPVVINMACRTNPGGGVKEGDRAQEEALCRRSTLFEGLITQPYPFPENGGIWSPDVKIFRKNERDQYSLIDQPLSTNVISVAAYNLSSIEDRMKLGLPCEEDDQGYIPALDEATLRKCSAYMQGNEANIRNMMRMLGFQGERTLILGALGCGAFGNPPEIMAEIFHRVLSEPEFQGRFESVMFPIFVAPPEAGRGRRRDQHNLDVFSAKFQPTAASESGAAASSAIP